MITFAEMAIEAHTTAVEKGWYDKEGDRIRQRSVPEIISLFHSEVSEAVEEFRSPSTASVRGIYFKASGPLSYLVPDDPVAYPDAPPTRDEQVLKPEGEAVELADLLIRMGDTAEAWGVADMVDRYAHNYMYPTGAPPFSELQRDIPPVAQLAYLHKTISRLFGYAELRWNMHMDMRDVTIIGELAHLFAWVYQFCRKRNLDLDRAIRLKLAYNKTRPYRHGGKTA